MATPVNAAPMVIDQGTKDNSTRTLPSSPLMVPQHCPLVWTYAGKGPIGRYYVDHDNVSLTQIYGDKTFDVNGPYFSHQTPFLQAFAANGNNMVVHRLVAPDATDVANVSLWLDVLETNVPVYIKNDDGSLKLDEAGQPEQLMAGVAGEEQPVTVAGYKVAWVTKNTVAPVGEYQRGLLTSAPGIQTEGGQQSTQYPIFEFSAMDQGEDGNNLAVKLFPALQTDITPFPDGILNEGKVYPYYFGMVRLMDEVTGITNPVLNSFGSQQVTFITKEKGTHPSTGATIDLNKVTKDLYINVPVAQQSGLGVAYTYHGNLNNVLEMFYNAEKDVSDEHRDEVINNTEENFHALNIVSFCSSNGSPYKSVHLVNVEGATRITKNTNIFMGGSSDGTITKSLMDAQVAADLENYNSSLHEYNDLVKHPESIIYDSGFTNKTKKVFPKFIARRKDTFVALSTYAHDNPAASLDEQYSTAISLKTMIELYPESATFGTSVMRGIVVGGSGDLINSLYTERVPVLYEVAYKASRYMGAKDGKWKNGYLFDKAPLSVVGKIKNIDVTWVPASTRNTLWSAGLCFVLNYSIEETFIPAIQTVYEDDTSVLNSFFCAIAISYLNKIQHASWREFSGVSSLTNAQLETQVDAFISKNIKDKFDDMFVIIPETTVTEEDAIRGFSWHSNVKIYAPNMKTVAIARVEAYRIEDLG